MSGQAELNFRAGEYEILKAKAESGWWDSGSLVLTNHRLFWFPGRFTSAPKIELDLHDIFSCEQVRSPKYLFLQPSLRLTLKDGSVHELHDLKEIDEVQRLILQNMNRQRYEPGSLFKE